MGMSLPGGRDRPAHWVTPALSLSTRAMCDARCPTSLRTCNGMSGTDPASTAMSGTSVMPSAYAPVLTKRAVLQKAVFLSQRCAIFLSSGYQMPGSDGACGGTRKVEMRKGAPASLATDPRIVITLLAEVLPSPLSPSAGRWCQHLLWASGIGPLSVAMRCPVLTWALLLTCSATSSGGSAATML
eukprot:2008954-Rhodomonas_salina.3